MMRLNTLRGDINALRLKTTGASVVVAFNVYDGNGLNLDHGTATIDATQDWSLAAIKGSALTVPKEAGLEYGYIWLSSSTPGAQVYSEYGATHSLSNKAGVGPLASPISYNIGRQPLS